MRIALLALACSGCIAGTVKAHTGVVADEYGRGVQAGVSLGFGYAGRHSAVVETIGFSGGQAPYAGLDLGLDYVAFPDHDEHVGIAWRVGVGGVPIAYGSPASVGVRLGSLFIVRDHEEYGGHEKGFREWSRTVHAVGIEAMVGKTIHDQWSDMPRSAFGGSAQVTYELYLLSRMW